MSFSPQKKRTTVRWCVREDVTMCRCVCKERVKKLHKLQETAADGAGNHHTTAARNHHHHQHQHITVPTTTAAAAASSRTPTPV